MHYFVKLLHDKGLLLRMYTQNIDGLERCKLVKFCTLVQNDLCLFVLFDLFIIITLTKDYFSLANTVCEKSYHLSFC